MDLVNFNVYDFTVVLCKTTSPLYRSYHCSVQDSSLPLFCARLVFAIVLCKTLPLLCPSLYHCSVQDFTIALCKTLPLLCARLYHCSVQDFTIALCKTLPLLCPSLYHCSVQDFTIALSQSLPLLCPSLYHCSVQYFHRCTVSMSLQLYCARLHRCTVYDFIVVPCMTSSLYRELGIQKAGLIHFLVSMKIIKQHNSEFLERTRGNYFFNTRSPTQSVAIFLHKSTCSDSKFVSP
ncbi:hypothetical protein HNY73_006754 [Argiope bruennichi]|uniref:Uncharacterized protein n=1 Tax=Argiope bruennichi TaxID=94029 RepID=A0A8T0FEU5_ARGBR|nr:hypothetical protein HNY73_006754 [Argiope bruennichi]